MLVGQVDLMDIEVVEREELPYKVEVGDEDEEETVVFDSYRITVDADDAILHLFGIEHTPRFYRAYGDVIEKYVVGADAVILESPVDLAPDTNVEPFTPHPENGFKPYTRMAREYDALLHVADPISTGTVVADGAATLGGSLTVLGGLLVPLYRRVRARARWSEGWAGEELIGSRREFLQSAGLVAGGGYLFGASTAGTVTQGVLDAQDGELDADDSFHTYGWDDRLSLGAVDYRNVVSAARIERIVEEGEAEEYVVVYGGAHTGDILGYLQEDPTRILKRAAYTPADLLGEELHTYQVRDGEWAEIDFPADLQ